MKREYFGMLFIVIITAFLITADYIFEEKIVADLVNRYVIIWILAAFYIGQYSMKYPKAF